MTVLAVGDAAGLQEHVPAWEDLDAAAGLDACLQRYEPRGGDAAC
jgi:hypothetical protein